ncbi:biotin synthase [Paucibacter sp. Y2R2-4]|uniref:biotin synthase n=1 Tax=Paucibacter sp. Y2R2-4 TaxID=2893553 RepID=UPI0021E45FB4|nr:biotin synthase [Paucibacter sp. Y2R2-4]MCV2349780.1 biotin synthase [Paucibacter sp. Y2R2-4]
MSSLSSPPNSEAAKAPRPQALSAAAVFHHQRRIAALGEVPWLHQEVAKRMAERLSIIKLQPKQVLQWQGLIGGGAKALTDAYPQAEQCNVELTADLRARSQALNKRAWWQALRGDSSVVVEAPEALKAGQAGLVWANMGLHASPDPVLTLRAWHEALAIDGFVMFSCLGPDSFKELRAIYAQQGWGRCGPDWWDMHDIGDLMVEAGFADPVMDQERLSLTWADPESLLKDLRALGGNYAPDRFGACRGRLWRTRLLESLETLRDAEGRLRLSLELVYGHAFKPVPKLRMSAETSLSLEQMRAMVRRSSN